MEKVCPLPVDWLDFLEGSPTQATADHLAGCRSCQEVVKTLKARRSINAFSKPDIDLAFARPWTEQRREDARPGEIWLTASTFAEGGFSYEAQPRVPVLVLKHSDRSDGRWLEVVPAWTERSANSDFRLAEHETTLGAQLMLMFRLQGMVAQRQLDARVGVLTESGEGTLSQVLGGVQDEGRLAGTWSDADLIYDMVAWLESAIRRVEGFYLYFREHRESTKSVGQKVGIIPMTLRDRSAWSSEQTWAFAASIGPPAVEREVRIQIGDLYLVGRLRHDLFGGDRLVLRFEDARGLAPTIRLAVRARSGEFISEQIVPAAGEEVVLLQGKNVFLNDVEGVDLVMG